VGFTLPPFKMKRNGGSVWYSRCPCWKWNKMGGGMNATRRPRSKQRETGVTCGIHAAPIGNEKETGAVCGPHLNKNSPPTMGGGIIKLEQGGVWLLRRLVGFWNKKRGRREHEWLPFSHPFPLHPHSSLPLPPCSLSYPPHSSSLPSH
jgi:hypothetical protein